MKKRNTIAKISLSLVTGALLLLSIGRPCLSLAPSRVMAVFPAEGALDTQDNQQKDSALPPEIRDRIFLSLTAEKAEAYPDESIGLSIKLSYNNLSLQDIQYPRLPPGGFSAGTFGEPVQNAEVVKGIEYKTLEFKTSVSSRKPGNFRLGPAHLQLSLLLPSGNAPDAFFGGRKTSVVKISSGEISLQIKPFPAAGRPADFSGAVGAFDLTVDVQPSTVNRNDPLSLMTTIKGRGSLSAAKCPGIPAKSGFRIHEPVTSRREGMMSCEQVIIPLTDTIQEIPAVTFSYFDPQTTTYHKLTKGPFPIKVIVPSAVKRAVDQNEKTDTGNGLLAETLRKRIGVIFNNPVVLFSYLLLSVCITILLILLNRRRKIIRGYINNYQTRLRAKTKLKKGIRKARRIINNRNSLDFYTIVFRTLQEYLGYLLKAPPAGITVGNLYASDMPGDFDADLVEKIRAVFAECDHARYALTEPDQARREEVISIMINAINMLSVTTGIGGIVTRCFRRRI
jgi:hypothetical protein